MLKSNLNAPLTRLEFLIKIERGRLSQAFNREHQAVRRSYWIFFGREKNDEAPPPALRRGQRRLQIQFVGAKLLLERLARRRVVSKYVVSLKNPRDCLFGRDSLPLSAGSIA